jgi:hypothetical protein
MLRNGAADHADELSHHAETAGPRNRAERHWRVARDHPEQCRLARAVRPDERHLRALAHPEAHVGEEHSAVRQDLRHTGDVHVPHKQQILPATAQACRADFARCRPGRSMR